MVDEFNEFLFDFTSKIPGGEIEKAKENKKDKKAVSSPYTKVGKKNNNMKIVIISIVAVLALLIIGYFVLSGVRGNEFRDDNTTYVIRR